MRLFFLFILCLAAFSSRETGRPVFAQQNMRPDYFYLPPGSEKTSDISESNYQFILTQFLLTHHLEVYQNYQLPLVIKNEWSNPYFAAFAQKKEDALHLTLWGGMARAPGATPSALVAILCHELGHVLGGSPKQTIPNSDWASTEGQSDFYAASVCLPKVLEKYPQLRSAPTPEVQSTCQGNELCEGVLQSGLEMMRLLQKYSYREFTPVQILESEQPAKELVLNSYPSDQCRLDTFVAGALCQINDSCRAPRCWLP